MTRVVKVVVVTGAAAVVVVAWQVCFDCLQGRGQARSFTLSSVGEEEWVLDNDTSL